VERVSGGVFGARVDRTRSISPGPGPVRNSSPRIAGLFEDGMGHSRSPFRPRHHPTKQLLPNRTPGEFKQVQRDPVQRLKIVDLTKSLSYINAQQERCGACPNAIFSTQPAQSGAADLSTGLTTRKLFHGEANRKLYQQHISESQEVIYQK
jgi:hypothetical protein